MSIMNTIHLNEDLWKKITPREKEIAEDIRDGLTTHQISAKRFISWKTVEAHRHNMLKKTGFKNSVTMILAMVKGGIIAAEGAAI